MLTASVILIGMPGCGKSTVGKLLSKRLGVDFCDTDDLIVESTGEPLQETLNKYGRDGFLERERDVLMNFTAAKPMVISTGGSVVLHKDVMERFKEMGTIVFLDADLPLLRKRLWNLDTRGIVFSDTKEGLLEVYKEREPLYYKYADLRIHIKHKRVNDMVTEIIQNIG